MSKTKTKFIMNIREIKLALTVDLMNLPENENPIDFALEKLDGLSSQTGHFKGSLESNLSTLNENIELKKLAFEYDNCTLNMDMIKDTVNNEEYLQNFNLVES